MSRSATVRLATALALMSISGCADMKQSWSHTKSQLVGLDRQVTLYANDGTVIKQWQIKGTIEDQGGSFRFLSDGKAITIAGTVLIEEQ